MNPTKKSVPETKNSVKKKQCSDSKLLLLRFHDPTRHWQNLNDPRVCILCGNELTGHSIRVKIERGRPAFLCPSNGCQGQLPHFAIAGNPLISEEVWQDWMRSPLGHGSGYGPHDGTEAPSNELDSITEVPMKNPLQAAVGAYVHPAPWGHSVHFVRESGATL